ncbi:unnamed protein product [Pseudo-nitzschia multistriata]|uniref:NAD(P)-binding domain-containing protein n=1 Tax=Pseudo-nitzschia multistriata TaxID=183589 RepID=A0A448ZRR6_9STRA|nr:unnamed protein product [Pseudo-nitzschia multistriata]
MKDKILAAVYILGWALATGDCFSPNPATPISARRRQAEASVVVRSSNEDGDSDEPLVIPTSDVVKKVAVTGATGKTGKLVVEELLSRNVQVVGLVRNETKAEELYGGSPSDMLDIQVCNLSDPSSIEEALEGCDATIWCATGFSDAPGGPPTTTVMSSEQSIDVVGVPVVAKTMLRNSGSEEREQAFPNVVMLSSAGTTRPGWDEEKKDRLRGCADIPIVRLNPFGILGLKAESEAKLRDTGADYCIVRPCGLNDNWPEGARPVVSQGDVAVGRINRRDVSRILCDVLSLPEALHKTFEVLGLGGYPPPSSIGPALERLRTDSEPPSEAEVEATYLALQQLLPGERQDAAALAMGQTYEQLDRGETGRLGERGTENVDAAGIKPTTAAA